MGLGARGEVGGGVGRGAEYRSGRSKKNDLSLTNTVVKKILKNKNREESERKRGEGGRKKKERRKRNSHPQNRKQSEV